MLCTDSLSDLPWSFCTIEALCEAVKTSNAGEESDIRCVILFDNEEVGSVSHHGAESNLLPAFVERIVQMKDYKDMGYYAMLANSFLISADMGHAVSFCFFNCGYSNLSTLGRFIPIMNHVMNPILLPKSTVVS